VTAKATAPAREAEVICDECDKVIHADELAVCIGCSEAAASDAASEAEQETHEECHTDAGEIRKWAARRHLMGQISREVREQLELCADDIEVGHG
jgi:hypothetical protein